MKQLLPAKGRAQGLLHVVATSDLHPHSPSCSYFYYKWI